MGIYARDSFDRANAAIGNADLGGAWGGITQTGTVFSTDSNKARCSTASGVGEDCITLDTGLADCVIDVDIDYVTGSDTGLIFRSDGNLANASNFNLLAIYAVVGVSKIELYKVPSPGHGYVQVGSTISGTLTVDNMYHIKIVLSRNNWTVYVNGVEQFAVSDAHQASATRHGMRSGGDTTTLFNNFLVTDLPGAHPVSRMGRVLSS